MLSGPRQRRFGLGLRPPHYPEVLQGKVSGVDSFEIISENFMGKGLRSQRILDSVRRDYPISCHGVSLSIGSASPLDRHYLKALKELVAWLEPESVSDHLAWTSLGGKSSYDLLPLPLNQESLEHIRERIDFMQNFLGSRFLLENPSAYVSFVASDRSEAEFLAELCQRTGCGILLDLNNCIVNQKNLGWDPEEYLRVLKPEWVAQIHLAGHKDQKGLCIDTHDQPVAEDVWKLCQKAFAVYPTADVIVEWDSDLPPFEDLCRELDRARALSASPAREHEPKLNLPSTSTCGHHPTSASLAQVQSHVLAIVQDHQDISEGLDKVKQNNPTAASVALSYYQNAYGDRLLDVLAAIYPICVQVLGQTDFNWLMRDFIEARAKDPFALQDVGQGLSEHIKQSERLLPPHPQSFLVELAAWEEQLFAASLQDPTPLDQRLKLQELLGWSEETWDEVVLQLAHPIQVLFSEWNIGSFCEAQKAQQPLPKPRQEPCYHLMYTEHERVAVKPLPTEMASCWKALARGAKLKELCEILNQEEARSADSGLQLPRILPLLLEACQQNLLAAHLNPADKSLDLSRLPKLKARLPISLPASS